jgi:hypothetical protein
MVLACRRSAMMRCSCWMRCHLESGKRRETRWHLSGRERPCCPGRSCMPAPTLQWSSALSKTPSRTSSCACPANSPGGSPDIAICGGTAGMQWGVSSLLWRGKEQMCCLTALSGIAFRKVTGHCNCRQPQAQSTTQVRTFVQLTGCPCP